MVEADVVRPAGRPVLHVAQVGVPIDQHVSAAEQRQQSEAELQCRRLELCHGGVPAVQRGAVTSHRERGQPPLELPEARGGRDVGAQQVAAVDVPDRRRRKQSKVRGGRGQSCGARKDALTVCYTGPRCPCPSRSCLSPSLRCSTSRNRTCRPPSPLEGPRWKKRGRLSALRVNLKPARRTSAPTDVDLLSPQMYLHCLSLVLHLPLKQRPCGQTRRSMSSLSNELKSGFSYLILLTGVSIHLVHIWWTLRSQRTRTIRSFTFFIIQGLVKPMSYLNILKCFRVLWAHNAPGFVAGLKGFSYHTQNERMLLH